MLAFEILLETGDSKDITTDMYIQKEGQNKIVLKIKREGSLPQPANDMLKLMEEASFEMNIIPSGFLFVFNSHNQASI